MRPPALLAALLLLALQAWAGALFDEGEEDAFLEQPEDGVSVSFTATEVSAFHKTGPRKVFSCRCRLRACGSRGQVFGICRQGNRNYVFCCH